LSQVLQLDPGSDENVVKKQYRKVWIVSLSGILS